MSEHKFLKEDIADLLRLRALEDEVKKYLLKITNNEIGYGENPIGFLIASHAAIKYDVEKWMEEVKTGKYYGR